MSRLELVKLIVQPVVLERDDTDQIIGEKLGEPTPLYTIEQVQLFLDTLQAQIVAANAQNGDGTPEQLADANAQMNGAAV